MSYNKLNLAVLKGVAKNSLKPSLACVAFYGNRTIATNSFSLVEISADGEAHAPVLIPAVLLKAVKLTKGQTIGDVEAIGIKPLDDTFPDVDQVTAQEYAREGDRTIKVKAEYLIEMLQALKDVNRIGYVTLRVPETETRKPLIIEADGEKGQTGKALVMPLNR